MDWTEIKITVDTKDIDTAGDIANMVVPYGIYIEDYSDLEREAMEIAHIDLIDEGHCPHIYRPAGSPAGGCRFSDGTACGGGNRK